MRISRCRIRRPGGLSCGVPGRLSYTHFPDISRNVQPSSKAPRRSPHAVYSCKPSMFEAYRFSGWQFTSCCSFRKASPARPLFCLPVLICVHHAAERADQLACPFARDAKAPADVGIRPALEPQAGGLRLSYAEANVRRVYLRLCEGFSYSMVSHVSLLSRLIWSGPVRCFRT